jgi:hypothetical protein
MKRIIRILKVKWKRYWHWHHLQWVKIDEWSRDNGYY